MHQINKKNILHKINIVYQLINFFKFINKMEKLLFDDFKLFFSTKRH